LEVKKARLSRLYIDFALESHRDKSIRAMTKLRPGLINMYSLPSTVFNERERNTNDCPSMRTSFASAIVVAMGAYVIKSLDGRRTRSPGLSQRDTLNWGLTDYIYAEQLKRYPITNLNPTCVLTRLRKSLLHTRRRPYVCICMKQG
jgi:hypothetical protein